MTTLTGVEHDLSTPTKIIEAKSLRQRLINDPLAHARKVSKALKSKLSTVSAEVGAELVLIEADYAAADLLITPQIEAREAEVAEKKRIADEKERDRKAAHESQLAVLAGYVDHAKGLPSERIAAGIAKVQAIVISRPQWEEFADRAWEQRAVTLERLQAMHDETKAREVEAARLEALRAEQAAEAARLKVEADRIAAEQKAEAARLAAERAAFEAEKAALRAQQAEAQRLAAAEKLAKEQQAERDAEAAAFEAWIGATSPSGDVESVQRQWEASPEYHELHGIAYTPAQAPQQVLKAEPETAEATDRDEPAITSPSVGSMGAGQAADAAPSERVNVFKDLASHYRATGQMPAPAAEKPTLKLGDIQAAIAPFSITADGLAQLGHPHVATAGAAKLWHPSTLPKIKAAAVRLFSREPVEA